MAGHAAHRHASASVPARHSSSFYADRAMLGNDELEAEDLPWDTLEATPVPLLPNQQKKLTAVPIPPFIKAAPLSVLIDPREGCGGHLWHAALELCVHLDTHPAWANRDLRGEQCLELGAGTGLAGMYAARRGAQVLCTDLAVMLPVLQQNIDLNFPKDSGASIAVAEYCWGTDSLRLGGPFDVILASDCVYLEGAFEPLLKSLEALMVPGKTTLLLSYQHRRKAESAFFRRLWKLFTLVPSESRHGPRTTPGNNTTTTTPSPTPAAATGATPQGAPLAMGKSHKVQILALRREPQSNTSSTTDQSEPLP